MICRGKGFLVVLIFGSSPTLSLPHLPSVSLTGDTKEDWERETAWWREKVNGQEMGYRSRIIQLQESLILYKSLNTLCSTHCTTTWHKLANRGGVYKQSVQKTPSACIICIHGDLHVADCVCLCVCVLPKYVLKICVFCRFIKYAVWQIWFTVG
jgi:hypothetical protein